MASKVAPQRGSHATMECTPICDGADDYLHVRSISDGSLVAFPVAGVHSRRGAARDRPLHVRPAPGQRAFFSSRNQTILWGAAHDQTIARVPPLPLTANIFRHLDMTISRGARDQTIVRLPLPNSEPFSHGQPEGGV